MLQYLQQVPKEDARYNEAVVILARAFIRRGWGSMAVERLEAVLAGRNVRCRRISRSGIRSRKLSKISESFKAFRTLSGIAPVTKKSGKRGQLRPTILMRRARSLPLNNALHHWASNCRASRPTL